MEVSHSDNWITEKRHVFYRQFLTLQTFSTDCVHSVLYFASQIKEMRSEILVTDIIV